MKKTALTMLPGLLALALTGCNTTRGIGQDIEATGEKIEEVAEDARERLSEDED